MSAHGPDYDSRSLLAGLRASAVIDKAKEKPMTLPSQSAGRTQIVYSEPVTKRYWSRQGKCVPCVRRWVWNGAPLVRDARCPECGNPLERTSYKLKFPVANLHTLEKAT